MARARTRQHLIEALRSGKPIAGELAQDLVATIFDIEDRLKRMGKDVVVAPGSSSTVWGDIVNKPTTFPPSEHEHEQYLTKETDPTVPIHVKEISRDDIERWNTPAPPSSLPIYATYSELVAADPSSRFGFVTDFGIFEKLNGRWVPSKDASNRKLFQYTMESAGIAEQHVVNPVPGEYVNIVPCVASGTIIALSISPGAIAYSKDGGQNWSAASVPTATWRAAEQALNSGYIYAFNIDLPGNRAAVSDDGGVNWSLQSTPASADIVWRAAAWDYAHDRIVVVGSGSSTSNNCMYKQRTTGWYSGTTANNNDLLDVCYDTKRNRLVAVGNGGGLDRCQISTDGGATWTTRNMPSASGWIRVRYSAIKDRLFAVSYGGDNRVAYSDDGGDTWSTVPDLDSYSIFGLAEVTDWCRMVCLGTDGRMFYSDDYGETWHPGGNALISPSYCLAYNPSNRTLLSGGLYSPYITKSPGSYL